MGCEKVRSSIKSTLRGIRTMRCKIRHAADSVALNLYIRTKHLSNEGFEAAKLDDEKLVVSCRDINHMGWV